MQPHGLPIINISNLLEGNDIASAAQQQTAHAVMRGIALSLGLSADYFYVRYTSDPLILFRIFHYPPQKHFANEQWGVGEHTDYGLLTLLKQGGGRATGKIRRDMD